MERMASESVIICFLEANYLTFSVLSIDNDNISVNNICSSEVENVLPWSHLHVKPSRKSHGRRFREMEWDVAISCMSWQFILMFFLRFYPLLFLSTFQPFLYLSSSYAVVTPLRKAASYEQRKTKLGSSP